MQNPQANDVSPVPTLRLGDPVLYLVSLALIVGNVGFPVLVHRVPMGGQALMPIMFFTLVAGWVFGLPCAALTAILSPLVSFALSGMSLPPALPKVILHSLALGLLAAWFSRRPRGARLAWLALAVGLHQVLVTASSAWVGGVDPALKGLLLRVPGILLQIFGGYLAIRLLERFRRSEEPGRC